MCARVDGDGGVVTGLVVVGRRSGRLARRVQGGLGRRRVGDQEQDASLGVPGVACVGARGRRRGLGS